LILNVSGSRVPTTNGIARQCTMQIVDREIAIRSRYLDAAIGKEVVVPWNRINEHTA